MEQSTESTYPDLKTWRTAKRLNQIKAAEYLGISQKTYNLIERRVSAPRANLLKRIMDRTGVPLDGIVSAA